MPRRFRRIDDEDGDEKVILEGHATQTSRTRVFNTLLFQMENCLQVGKRPFGPPDPPFPL